MRDELETLRADNLRLLASLREARQALSDMLKPYGAVPASPPYFTADVAALIANARRIASQTD